MMTFDELSKEITDFSEVVKYDGYELNQETELGGTIVLMNVNYKVYVDVNDEQSEFYLSTYRYGNDGLLEDTAKNVRTVKSIKAVKNYLYNFAR